MAHVLNYPVNTSDAMDKWRADAAERKAAEERFRKELGAREEADREQRRGVMSQAQSDGFNAWFDARFAQAVAEGSPFDNAWVASIAEALARDRQRMFDHVANVVAEVETRFEARLAQSEKRAQAAEERANDAESRLQRIEAGVTEARAQLRDDVLKLGDDLRDRMRDAAAVVSVETREQLEAKFASQLAEVEKRAEAAEERARVAETGVTELRRLVRNDVIRLSNDLRERTCDAAAAPAAELRADVGEKFEALRGEFGEKIASLSARPSIDEGQVDRIVEAAVARTRIETRAEFDRALESRLEEKGRVFEERIAEFERRTVSAEERARALDTVVVDLRQQVCNDAIRLADDLRGRVRDASAVATIELRSEVESKFAARLMEAEKRAERADERVRTFGVDLVEFRVQARDDCIRTGDDLRHRIDDATAVAGIQLRSEFESKFASRLVEAEKRAEHAEERAKTLEIAMVELRGAFRDDVARASGDLRQQARDAAATATVELHAEIESKFTARLAEAEKRAERDEERGRALEIAMTDILGAVRDDVAKASAASAKANTELRADLESKFAGRLTEAEKTAKGAEAKASAAEARVPRLEAEATEARAQLRDDVIKTADDLRARVHNMFAAASAEMRGMIEARFVALAERPGRMPIARAYEPDTITRAGHFVAFNGGLFQAIRDTARRPGVGQDWLVVARGGKDGVDGKSVVLRGTFDLRDAYTLGDLVGFEGQTFVATRNNPTGIPSDGDGWQLLAARREGREGRPWQARIAWPQRRSRSGRREA
jgi:hypothetical protein